MKRDEFVSEEKLGAFTDGELDAEEENCIFELAERSPELDARLCQQRKLKEMIQHAYRRVPRPDRRGDGAATRRGLFSFAVAAMLLLGIGLAGGFIAGAYLQQSPGPFTPAGTAAPAAQEQPVSYLLHVTSSNPARMQAALDRARSLVEEAGGDPARQVEIVANESGLDLLRSDVTPFAAEVKRLAQQNVLFFACTNAIARLERQGIEVKLLPEANSDYSALDRVVLRLHQGWKYIKI